MMMEINHYAENTDDDTSTHINDDEAICLSEMYQHSLLHGQSQPLLFLGPIRKLISVV